MAKGSSEFRDLGKRNLEFLLLKPSLFQEIRPAPMASSSRLNESALTDLRTDSSDDY